MRRLAGYIEAVMADPAPRPPLSPATLLAALSGVYGGAMALRADLYRRGILHRRRLPCRVVSVGNLTVGGTGKTPLTMDLAARLRHRGWPVCVLSRGYRGTAEQTGAVVSDGCRVLVPAKVAGDEPWLMARRLSGIPVIVGRDRYASGMTAVNRFGARVVVLDDAFQHLGLARDLDILLLDARAPLANGYLLPRGRLREPFIQARRAHAWVRIHRHTWAGGGTGPLPAPARPVLDAILDSSLAMLAAPGGAAIPQGATSDFFKGRRVVAFAGIAGNASFFDALETAGATLTACLGFADHHAYRSADLERILSAARRTGADCLATTAKDHARLDAAAWPLPLAVMDLAVAWSDGGAMIDGLLDRCMAAPQGP